MGSASDALTANRSGREPTIIGVTVAGIVFGMLYRMTLDSILPPLVGFDSTVPMDFLAAHNVNASEFEGRQLAHP